MSEGSNSDTDSVQIEWHKDGTTTSVVLKLDLTAKLALAAKPLAAGLDGAQLVTALRARGAVLHDGIGKGGAVIPAWQEFDAQTGNRTQLEHYQAGKLEDPANGEPAIQGFYYRTGTRTRLEYYQAGRFQDPASGEPAIQMFDALTGRRIACEHHQAGKHQDPASGEPAIQMFAAQTGKRIAREHYQAGKLQDPASGEPAVQTFDPQTGNRTGFEHYKDGERQPVRKYAPPPPGLGIGDY